MSLPTGILTFCFTDVEGSSGLWEQHPDAMARALVWHDRLVADTIAAHGGHLILSMGEGDSTVSVFANAASGVAAAISLQRALRRDSQNELDLAVRVGLHTGSAEQRDATYFGSTVNLAARVRGLADGGHIFLSSAAREALGTDLPDGCEIVDLGAHSLRGFAAREEIYAVTADDLKAPPSTDCPYQGLRAYGPDDGDRFFGRDRTVAEAVQELRSHSWLCVVGSSGSGKSSLLRAGVAARWGEAVVLTPGGRPAPVTDIHGLLVVDQLEELWTICDEPELRDAFIDSLLEYDGPVAVGIRADFYGNCGDHPALAAKVSAHQLLLGAMTDEELRSAVVEPARAFGLRVDPGLVELLVREVANRPGALPLLSHALLATWERRDGRTLTLDAYRAAGGVGAAIAATAETVYAELNHSQREAAKAVLLRLVEPGEGVDDARRRATVAEIASVDTGTPAMPVVDALAGARLLTVDDTTVELAHEALIREWPRLRAWIDDEREAFAIRRHLTGAAAAWEQLGRDPSELYSGPRLAALLDWLKTAPTLSTSERDFADASRAESERVERTKTRSVRRLRTLVVGVSVALVAALLAGGFALIKQQDAADSRDRADIARVAAVSRSLVERQPDLGLLLAVAAFELDNTEETRGALLEGLQANPLLFGLLHGVDSGLESAVFSPDGRKLVTPTADGTGSIVWSTTSRRRLAVLDRGNGILQDAAISPSGRWLAVPAIYEKPKFAAKLQVWDLARDRLVRMPRSPAGALSSAAFSADGDTLITQGGPQPGRRFGTEVVLWDTRTWRPRGKPLVVNREYAGDRTVAVSADGELLAVPLSSGGVQVWSSSARTAVGTLPATSASVTALAFAPKASSLAIGDDDGGVRFLDPRTGRAKAKPLALSESSAAAIDFSTGGSRVAVGRQDGRTQIFDLRSGEQLGPPLAANAAAINDVSFSADGRLLATAGLDRTGALWRLDGNRAIGTVFRGQNGAISEAAYTPDGKVVLTAGADGSVAAREPGTGSIMRRFRLGGEVLSAAVSPDGSTLAAGGTAGRVALWPIDDSSAEPISVDLDGAWAQQVAFSPDGKQLAVAVDGDRGAWEVGSGRGRVRFVNPATGAETARRLDLNGGVPIGVAFSPDGAVLAVTADNNVVRLYDARTHKPLGQPLENVDSAMLATAFARDSERLATGTTSGSVLQWNVREHAVIEPPLEGDEGAIGGVAYSPDGALLATSRGGFSTTQLWRADNGARFAGTFVAGALPFTERTFNFDHFLANRPTFSPSGDRLVTTGLDRATVSWTLDPDQWRNAACAVAGRELSKGEWRQYLPDRDPYPLCER
jgi:WD40 repeat protein/class 3 adenylate cyclase